MLKEFEHIPALSDLCRILGRNEDNLSDLLFLIGKKESRGGILLDILHESGMIESKSRFRKNPQAVFANGEKKDIDFSPKKDFVLSIGKGSAFKCTYIKLGGLSSGNDRGL